MAETVSAPSPQQQTHVSWRASALIAALILACCALMWWLASVFVPLGLGLTLAYLLAPAADRLQGPLGSRTRAAIVVVGGFGVALVLCLGAATPVLVREARHWAAAVAGEGTAEVARHVDSLVDYGRYADPDLEAWTTAELVAAAKQQGASADVLEVLRLARPPTPPGDGTLSDALGDRDGDGILDPGYGQRWRQLSRERRTWLGALMSRIDRSGLPAEAERWATRTLSRNRLEKLVGADTLSTAGDVGLRILGSVRQVLSALGLLALSTVLIPVYAFLFLLALPRWKVELPQYLPRDSRALWLRVGRRIARSIAAFLRGRLIVCAIVGAMTAAGWWALDVRLGLLLGLLTGALTLVPLASVLALLPVLLMSLLEVGTGLHGWGWLAGVCGVFVAGQLADSALNPIVVGDAVELDMMTMIVSLLVGGAALGFVGLLLAVPVAASLRILAQEVVLPRWRVWAQAAGPAAAGEDPTDPPPT